MAEKASLGEFEHHVLLATLRLGANAYTTSILTELEERTNREVSAAAVFIALRRLEAAGLIRSRLRTATERNERRERRYVRVTPAGIKLVREAHWRFMQLWSGLNVVTAEPSS